MKAAALYSHNPKTQEETLLGVVTGEAAVGRSPEAQIQLNDIRCDGIHALIENNAEKGFLTITDLGSRFGTFVGGKRISSAFVRPGEPFKIGYHELMLRHLPSAQDEVEKEQEQSIRIAERIKGVERTSAILATEKRLLQVSMYWGEQLLEQHTFVSGEEITIGTQKAATFGISMEGDRAAKKPFVVGHYKKGLLHINVPPEATGMVWIGNDAFSIDYLRYKDRSTIDFKDLQLHLRMGDRADLQFWELSLSFRFIEPAEPLPREVMPAIDRTFFRVTLFMLGVFSLLALLAIFHKVPLPETTLKDMPKEIRRAVYDAGIANALKRRRAAIGELAKNEGGRAGGEEGMASSRRDPKASAEQERSKRANAKNNKSKIKAAEAKSRFSKANSKAGSQVKIDFSEAFSPSNRTKKNNAGAPALPGVHQDGNTIAAFTAQGAFARGTKGYGGGGGGKSVGIGSLSGYGTGGGMGAGDYGLLPSKGKDIDLPRTEELVILGGLDRDVIASVIKRYLPQIQYCYEKQLVVNPKLGGKVTVAFVIAGTGEVQSAEIVESSLDNEPTEGCMIEKIKGWKFPKPRNGGTVGVRYPFLLMSNAGG